MVRVALSRHLAATPKTLGRALINRDCSAIAGCRKRRVRIAPETQAIFCRRRHQPRRPPPAKIRPGRPAPAMGPGTAEGDVPMVRLVSAKNPNCVVSPSGNPNAIDEIRESLVTPKKNVWRGGLIEKPNGRSLLTEDLSPKVINAVYCGENSGGP